MEAIIGLIGNELKKLETYLFDSIKTNVEFIRTVASYVIGSGGKRIRPILLILSSRLCGDTSDRYLPYAASVEFIHTATLLHDDVIDGAKMRRGKSSVNAIFGNEASILTGDFLYSRAFDLMVENEDPEILRTMARTTNILSEGEILELLKTWDAGIKEEEYMQIVEKKTAILFSSVCEIGAILGGTTEEKREALKAFGHNFGIIFQITDDVLDYISSDQTLGKKIGTDLREGKITLPLIKALRDAHPREKSYITRMLKKRTPKMEDFEKVRNIIERHEGISYALSVSEKLKEKAKENLSIFPPSPYKDALFYLTDFLIKRDS